MGMFFVTLMAIGFIYLACRIFWITIKTMFLGVPNAMNTARLQAAKNYTLPNGVKRKTNIHKSYDYWDDAGNGSGVNYVTMPDGSVRID